MPHDGRMRVLLRALIPCSLALALAACGGATTGDATQAPAPATSVAPSAASSTEPATVAASAIEADPSWGHVHQLAYDLDGALVLGTHGGVVRLDAAGPTVLGDPFDAMGLARTADGWVASGHPAPGSDAPADLGLLASPDAATWSTVSLGGEVDFHRLSAGGRTVAGIAAHDGLLRVSTDGGLTWRVEPDLRAADVAVSADGAAIVATTQEGPMRSVDGGASFAAIPDAPLIGLVAWEGERLWGIAPDGTVAVGGLEGSWRTAGSLGEPAGALAAKDGRVAALLADRVVESTDGGATFAAVVTGLGH